MSLKFCSPEKVPPEIKLYDNKISQMDVGKTGKIGYLKIDLKHDLQKNKTIITYQKSQVPLFIQIDDIVRIDTREKKYIERIK